MMEHLLVSTVVLALAMLLARVLPLTARTRHAILLCGLAKFAVPTALFASLGLRTIDVLPIPRRVLDGTGGAVLAAAPRVNWLLVAWIAVATLILLRWVLLRTRTVASALRAPSPASPREVAELDAARRLLGIRTAVDIVRSPLCEAPAVLRVVRPTIILPVAGCDELTDEELRALLLHELAHVERRDNLVGGLTALAGALLWFHPLVWLALRQIGAAREQACDERVAEATSDAETYLDALTKVCRALLAPRTAGVSCMAGANVKERMKHLMNYHALRKTAWSHRGMVAASLVAILATTLFAVEAPPKANQNLYSLRFNVTPGERTVLFDVQIIDNATGLQVQHPRLTTMWGQLGTVTGDHAGRQIELKMKMDRGRPAEIFLIARENGVTLQRNLYTFDPEPKEPKQSEFSGEPISIELKDAEVRDVMRTFSKITGMEIVVAPDVTGQITIYAKDMPWDEALLKAAMQVGAKAVVDGKTIRITK